MPPKGRERKRPEDLNVPGGVKEMEDEGGLVSYYADVDQDPDTAASAGWLSAFNAASQGVPERVQETHEERSARAVAIDRAFNAPVTADPDVYARYPNRYDWPELDTRDPDVMEQQVVQATREAEEAGVISQYQKGVDLSKLPSGGRGSRGLFMEKEGGVIATAPDVARGEEHDPRVHHAPALAHELGHAVDAHHGGELRHKVTKLPGTENRDRAVEKELMNVSRMMRGDWDIIGKRKQYRQDYSELFADFYASLALQPRATAREAPRATRRLREKMEESDPIMGLF